MKDSYYNLEIAYKGNYCVFNTRTGACIILNESEYNAFKNRKMVGATDRLHELGIFVEDSLDEIQLVMDTIKNNILRDKEQIRSHTIYTTTFCNAHCPYCFENSFSRESMSERTALDVAQYIINQQNEAKKLYIIWFGGEPMLNPKVMDIISEKIDKELSQSVEFRTSMYTNGLLLTKEWAEYAKWKWHLKSVQVTLDGMKETYENVKQFGVVNAFERVIDNIKDMLDVGLRVQIRLNYDESTFLETLDFIEQLKLKFKGLKKIYVYAYKIFCEENIDNSKQATTDYDFAILEKLIECGFCEDILSTISRNMNTCLAGGEYSRLYLPNGEIIKCNRAMDSVVGNINGAVYEDEVNKWRNHRLNENCRKCKILPMCGGGCIYEFLNGKNGCMNSEIAIKQKLQYYMKNTIGE